MKNYRALSLVEVMVVVLLFSFLFGVIVTMLISSDRSFQVGRNKLFEQGEARKVILNIARLLRQASPDWIINGLHYPVSINQNSEINFYNPVFNNQGEITALKKITFKLDPNQPRRLLKKEGTQEAVVVSEDIESIYFSGGCDDVVSLNCDYVSLNFPVVSIRVTIKKNLGLVLADDITLRNTVLTLGDEVIVDAPEEGEF